MEDISEIVEIEESENTAMKRTTVMMGCLHKNYPHPHPLRCCQKESETVSWK